MDNVLKGALCFKGPRGYSAYEIAVQEGFKGTKEEWLRLIGVEEVIKHLPSVNVKQFGAVGDGVTNDTTAFQNAIDSMDSNDGIVLFVPKGTYNIDTLILKENTIVLGNNSVLNILAPDNAEVVQIKSNSYIINLTINSKNENKEWNRVDMSNQSNITIENCIITGFRNPEIKNAWGLYMKNSKNITIRNCMFDNNTQSDIAMTENTENILIENCKPLNEYMRINSEPNSTGVVKKVTIKNSDISFLTVIGNSPSVYNNQDFIIEGNTIDELMLQNVTCELINNDIKAIRPTLFSNKIYKNINSIGLWRDINNDVKLINIQPGNSENTDCWKMGYTPSDGTIKRAQSTKGKTLVCNPNLENIACSIERYFDVVQNEQYAINCLMNTKHPENTKTSGRGLNVFFYDSNNEKVSENKFLIDRTTIDLVTGGETEYAEKTVFLTVPEGAVKMRVLLSNYNTSSGAFATNWGKVNIQKINLDNTYIHKTSDDTTGSVIPEKINAFGDYYLGIKGDIIYLTNGVSYAAICTESGNPGVWKKVTLS